MAFRFLINMDQCLNMHNFDFFFYQKESSGELHLTPDVYIREGTGQPFGKAASDIRLYLDRFAYTIGDYQIIIATRSDYKKNTEVWDETLLSRLLDIDFELRKSNILIRSGLGPQIAVSLIVLLEADEIKEIHAVDEPYMGSTRMTNDFRLLLKEIGVPEGKEDDFGCVKNAWSDYLKAHFEMFEACPKMSDGTPEHSLYAFFTDLIMQYEKDEATGLSAEVSTLHEIKKLLNGYQIFELIIDKQNRDRDINSLLRVVEYATTDFAKPTGTGKTYSLNELCAAHWNEIAKMDDAAVQQKYAKMLHEYKERLSMYAATSKDGSPDTNTKSALPETKIPSENNIGEGGNAFEGSSPSGLTESDPKALINSFGHRIFPVSTLSARWDETQKKVSEIYGELEKKLSDYSDTLGKKYAEILNERKMEELTWHNKSFAEGENTDREIVDLTEKKKKLLSSLERPQMTPSLRFQDQLNVETALEQENQNIRHYIDCMEAVSGRSFVLLIILLTGMVTLLFGLLQSYDFESTSTAMYFLLYVIISFALMMFTWTMPMKYYRKKIQICLKQLNKETDQYIKGYFDRAKQLREYVNLINQLDYIERHLQLKNCAVKYTQWVQKANNWHLSQVKKHLQKLEFFEGLIETYIPEPGLNSKDGLIMQGSSGISGNHMDDVVDNKLFWPQRDGS